MLGIGKRSIFMPSLPGRKHPHLIQCEFIDGGLQQTGMRQMRRVKRPTKDTDAGALQRRLR